MGTAEIACPGLESLHSSSTFNVVSVVTQPDRPRGRKLELQPSPVKKTALDLGIAILQPKTLRTAESWGELADLKPDLIVVIAFGQILPQHVLDLPAHGCVNVHTSLLPKYRGAAPIQWAILEGAAETGVTLMQMDAGLDTGPIIATRPTKIESKNALELHDELASLGASLLLDALPKFIGSSLKATPQDDQQATHARKITKDDGLIDWAKTAIEIERTIRAFTPWPGARTNVKSKADLTIKIKRASVTQGNGQPGQVLSADKSQLVVACGNGALEITEVQRPGSRPMPTADFLRGCPIETGVTLG